MSIDDFVAKLKIELAALENPVSSPAADAVYMHAQAAGEARFHHEADRIFGEIIEPRMKALGSLFPNAAPARKTEPDHCIWGFDYTERFPASTKVDVSVTHDDQFETLSICYELLIVPAFIKYDRFDRLVAPLDRVDDDQVVAWLERRLLAFLRTYMSLGLSDRDRLEGSATDPVCGMRISKDRTLAFHDYAGHRYFFCSEACREEFSRNPTSHVTIVTR